VNGKRNGQGTYNWATGVSWSGVWVNDTMHGQGTQTNANGTSFSGTWLNGVYQQPVKTHNYNYDYDYDNMPSN
jgi:hypothetical protein